MDLETLLIKATSEVKESGKAVYRDIWTSIINTTVRIFRETGSVVKARAFYIMKINETELLKSCETVMEIHTLFYATGSRERKALSNIDDLKVIRKTKKKFERMEATYNARV